MSGIRLCLCLLMVAVLAACVNPAILEKKKKRSSAHFNIGMDALRSNHIAKAFDELMEANNILPHQPLVLDSLANAWRIKGDYVKAEFYFKEALKYGDIPSIHTNYASLLVQLQRFTEAKEQISITLQDPRYPKQDIAYILLGDALVGEGALDEGIQAYRRAGKINPRQIDSRLREGSVYVNSGRYSFAVALYETMLREYPDHRATLEGLLPLLFQQGETETAHHYLLVFQSKSTNEADRTWALNQLRQHFQ
ncbi:MAG: tetratricopeptide repeat protein [Mariprofundaceae bacterium]|nr:tetratricopeptide repeat protein [Mariprofundaceae bacterium]